MTNEQAIELLRSIKWDANIDEQEDKALSMAIEALEQAPRWVPCSEKPPEEVGTYLVTLDYGECGTGITTLWFHGSLGWDLRAADAVTAWMTLPKAYRRVKRYDNTGSD